MLENEENGSVGNDLNINQQTPDKGGINEEDLKVQMDATLAAEGLTDSLDEDDLELQMAAAMSDETSEDSEHDLEKQMAAAMKAEENIPIDENLLQKLTDEDDEDTESEVSVQPVSFQQLRPTDEQGERENIDRLLDVTLNLSVEIGRKQMQIKEILDLGPGKIIELDRLAGEPVDLLVNGKLLAKGEVVVVDENFGVRITDLIDPMDRIKSL